jgi:hypothetical protein
MLQPLYDTGVLYDYCTRTNCTYAIPVDLKYGAQQMGISGLYISCAPYFFWNFAILDPVSGTGCDPTTFNECVNCQNWIDPYWTDPTKGALHLWAEVRGEEYGDWSDQFISSVQMTERETCREWVDKSIPWNIAMPPHAFLDLTSATFSIKAY